MSTAIPEAATKFGFINDPVGTLGSRTIMLAELRLLLASCPQSASTDEYRSAIIDQNVLLKQTEATRRESFRRLRELYALSNTTLHFRALRDLWEDDPQAQPLLALLCAAARDPLLRCTAEVILTAPVDVQITPLLFSQAVEVGFPERYNSTTLTAIGKHAASSWRQSGHLSGQLKKVRSRAESRPAALVYALFLGYLCGSRGEGLFQTLWSRLLDAPTHILHDQAFTASQRGWIEYRHTGGVTDVDFRYLLREHGRRERS